jgi:hypothetical protein
LTIAPPPGGRHCCGSRSSLATLRPDDPWDRAESLGRDEEGACLPCRTRRPAAACQQKLERPPARRSRSAPVRTASTCSIESVASTSCSTKYSCPSTAGLEPHDRCRSRLRTPATSPVATATHPSILLSWTLTGFSLGLASSTSKAASASGSEAANRPCTGACRSCAGASRHGICQPV